MGPGNIIGWEGDWDYTEGGSPSAQRLALRDGDVCDKNGARIGTYTVVDRQLKVTFDPVGDAVGDQLVVRRHEDLNTAHGQRSSFTNDVPEEKGGSGPLRLIATLCAFASLECGSVTVRSSSERWPSCKSRHAHRMSDR